MRRVRIFSNANHALVQQWVNEWLANHQTAIIFNVLQTESQSDNGTSWSLTITIFYYEGEQGDAGKV